MQISSGFSFKYADHSQTSAIPHQSIFPRCATVVHHGGAGTVHASLLAGCPSVVVAHSHDQVFWAPRLQRLGVAGKPLNIRSVSARKLANEISNVTNSPDIKKKALGISKAMKHENGCKAAVSLIEERFNSMMN